MKKKQSKQAFSVLLIGFSILIANPVNANITDTTEGRYTVHFFRLALKSVQEMSCTIDGSWRTNTPSFENNVVTLQYKLGKLRLDHVKGFFVQDDQYAFTVDTVDKKIYMGYRQDLFMAMMQLKFDDGKIWSDNFTRAYLLDTGSLQKMVLETKQASSFGVYQVLFDPADMQVRQVKYSLKRNGVEADHVFITTFRDYQFSGIDDSVFDHTSFFKKVDGVLVLSEAYSNYELIDYPKP